MQRIGAVAFDLDGTTLNSEDLYLEVCSIIMERRGHVYDRETRSKMMGLPAPKAYEVLIECKSLTDTPQALQDECDEIFEGILELKLQSMPGVVELLDLLDQHDIPRCIATSSREMFARRALNIVNLLHRFDFVITAEHVPHGKPHPDIYLTAAERMESPVSELLVLEDSTIGVRAGVAAGAYTIAVPNEHTAGSVFEGAKLEVNSLLDDRLLNWLKHDVQFV
jgi:pseudouridine 5'-phosphatase